MLASTFLLHFGRWQIQWSSKPRARTRRPPNFNSSVAFATNPNYEQGPMASTLPAMSTSFPTPPKPPNPPPRPPPIRAGPVHLGALRVRGPRRRARGLARQGLGAGRAGRAPAARPVRHVQARVSPNHKIRLPLIRVNTQAQPPKPSHPSGVFACLTPLPSHQPIPHPRGRATAWRWSLTPPPPAFPPPPGACWRL